LVGKNDSKKPHVNSPDWPWDEPDRHCYTQIEQQHSCQTSRHLGGELDPMRCLGISWDEFGFELAMLRNAQDIIKPSKHGEERHSRRPFISMSDVFAVHGAIDPWFYQHIPMQHEDKPGWMWLRFSKCWAKPSEELLNFLTTQARRALSAGVAQVLEADVLIHLVVAYCLGEQK
jgi:hypothetical protein